MGDTQVLTVLENLQMRANFKSVICRPGRVMEMNKILKDHGNVMDIYFLDFFWTLTVLIIWQSMGQSQAFRFSSKIS